MLESVAERLPYLLLRYRLTLLITDGAPCDVGIHDRYLRLESGVSDPSNLSRKRFLDRLLTSGHTHGAQDSRPIFASFEHRCTCHRLRLVEDLASVRCLR